MPRIMEIKAREILDSRGHPTVEATVSTKFFSATASVPAGASRGKHEAKELRDGGRRYFGLGVKKAVRNIEKKIAPLLKKEDCTRQRRIDSLMIGKGKKKLGANAILAVSLACARVAAVAQGKHLFEYINELPRIQNSSRLPKLFFNVINGGKHADNQLSIQEFMIVPQFPTVQQNIQAGSEVYHALKKILPKKYGAANVGDEGGFAPLELKTTEEALKILQKAIKTAGYSRKVKIALDCAASEFFRKGKYNLDGKKLTKGQLLDYYLKLVKKYPIISIEDPFQQEDFQSFALLRKKSKIQIVGDDLTVTNLERVETAIEERSCNCLLLKVNQVGTLTEALDAARLVQKHGWKVMVSHRSGETEDSFIADLAVGLGCGMIKAGAPCRGERTAKYNQLLRIEEFLKLR